MIFIVIILCFILLVVVYFYFELNRKKSITVEQVSLNNFGIPIIKTIKQTKKGLNMKNNDIEDELEDEFEDFGDMLSKKILKSIKAGNSSSSINFQNVRGCNNSVIQNGNVTNIIKNNKKITITDHNDKLTIKVNDKIVYMET